MTTTAAAWRHGHEAGCHAEGLPLPRVGGFPVCGCPPVRAVTIRIDGRPPTPNARRHWRVTALDNDTWKGAARVVALASLPPGWTPLERCEMDVTFVFPTRGRHDWDNAIAAQKPVLDGIVAAGAIVDDSMTVITALRYGWDYAKGESATVYTITEVAA